MIGETGAEIRRPALTRTRLLLLAMLAALGSLAMHMLVPALPAIAAEFGTSQASTQFVIAIYLCGLGLGQLIAGPFADVFGRKPVLMCGIGAFLLMSLACAAATDLDWLIAARFVQALGGAAAIVTSRAIVSDLSTGPEATARMAALTSVVLLSPMVAPSLGGMLASWASWRWIFILLAACALLSGAITAAKLPGPPVRAERFAFPYLLGIYRRLSRNSRFRRFVVGNAAASSGLYIFLSGSPFLLIDQWGLDPDVAGFCYLGISAAGIVGTLLVSRLEARGGALRLGLGLMAAGSGLLLVLALSGLAGPAILLGPMVFVCLGSGIAAPPGIAGAMRAEPGVAGTASSVSGALQMLCSAAASGAMAASGAHSLTAVAAAIFACGSLAFLVAPAGPSVTDGPA